MKGYIIRIRRVEMDGEIMYEGRHDMAPDAVVFEDTADKAYDSMSQVLLDLLDTCNPKRLSR
jgi:hypothetical protein